MTTDSSNAAVADLLERHGKLLEVAGESPFRSRAFARAAASLQTLPEDIAAVCDEGRLRAIPGIGEGIAAAIEQILTTGSFQAHAELTARFPESLASIVTVPGIGPKTAQRMYLQLGVEDLASLGEALVSGRIREASGLGARVESTVRAGLESLERRTGRTLLGVALPIADAFVAAYKRVRPEDMVSLAGSARRWEPTVGDLDFVVATEDPGAAIAAIEALPIVASSHMASDRALRLSLTGSISADVFFTNVESWGSTLLRATGSQRHLDRLGPIPQAVGSEEDIYVGYGLPWIPPELRDGDEEFERWSEIPQLVTLADINGEFHAHTTWSDGAAPMRDMALAAAGRGYAFLGITDHSHGLGVAGGLDESRLKDQRRELDELSGIDGVTLFAGAEVEVHRDGALDFNDKILGELDVVVASLHSGLRQPREEITNRLLRVLENPYVDIVAHPSGRLIERREGGDFDWDRVFAVAAGTGTALEINADPARLDLDPHLARKARLAGCLFTVNCDAHSATGFASMVFGIAMARKAWLRPQDILNCWTLGQVVDWLSARGKSV